MVKYHFEFVDQFKRLTSKDRVEIKHNHNDHDFIYNYKFYFCRDVIERVEECEYLTFETATITERQYNNYKNFCDEGSERKMVNVIYAVNNYKDHKYFATINELVPLTKTYKNERRKLCVECNIMFPKINNNYESRLACKSCFMDKEIRTHSVKKTLWSW